MKTYKGKYRVKNREKYIGDADNVVYRSQWEKWCFLWCDKNPSIVEWCSEEIVVPYICETDKRPHRYYIDLYIKNSDGNQFLIEVKPNKETKVPTKKGKTKKRYLQEGMTYIKNQSKWKYATAYAKHNGMTFVIWTEIELKKYGIMKF